MLVGGVWYDRGACLPPGRLRADTARGLYLMRHIDLQTSEPVVDSSGHLASRQSEDESSLPGLASDGSEGAADMSTTDGGLTAGPPAGQPSPNELAALPDGWRNMHGATVKSLARRLTGVQAESRDGAVAILEEYERGGGAA